MFGQQELKVDVFRITKKEHIFREKCSDLAQIYFTLTVPLLSGSSSPEAFSWHWWYVVMAIAGAVSIAVLMAVYVAKLRRKETRFGCVGC